MSLKNLKRRWRGFERQHSTERPGPSGGHDGVGAEKCADVEYGLSGSHGRLEILKERRLILMWHVTPDARIDPQLFAIDRPWQSHPTKDRTQIKRVHASQCRRH